ncbi:hypothetical protein PFISCL1PPCAC_15270, partial [Pristionchus fissidentatus]
FANGEMESGRPEPTMESTKSFANSREEKEKKSEASSSLLDLSDRIDAVAAEREERIAAEEAADAASKAQQRRTLDKLLHIPDFSFPSTSNSNSMSDNGSAVNEESRIFNRHSSRSSLPSSTLTTPIPYFTSNTQRREITSSRRSSSIPEESFPTPPYSSASLSHCDPRLKREISASDASRRLSNSVVKMFPLHHQVVYAVQQMIDGMEPSKELREEFQKEIDRQTEEMREERKKKEKKMEGKKE